MYSVYSKYPSYPGSHQTQVITSGQVIPSQQYWPAHHQLSGFADTFHCSTLAPHTRPSMYGNILPTTDQLKSVAPLGSFYVADTNKSLSAPSNINTSDYLDSKDYSKLEEMLNEDNVNEEYKSLIKQQISKIQHSRAEAKKCKLIEKEIKAHKDAIAYFKKQEEEKLMHKQRLKGKSF